MSTKENPFSKFGSLTIPEVAIFMEKMVWNIEEMRERYIKLLYHEYGHKLQAEKYGGFIYWNVIAPQSFLSATYAYINKNFKHEHTIWEIEANRLSQKYFNIPQWDTQNNPLNYDKINIIIGPIPFFLRNY